VLDRKAEILSGVRLDKLVHNLAITGDLIHADVLVHGAHRHSPLAVSVP
jgi:hypothetical protein